VAAVDEVDLRIGEIAGERRGPGRTEDLVAAAPDRQQRHLAGAEVVVHGGVV
jgi:hypothetical protein